MRSSTKHVAAAFLLLMSACKNPNSTKEPTAAEGTGKENSVSPAVPPQQEECYKSQVGNSMVELNVMMNDAQVTGMLNYLPEAKDKNTGSIQGKMNGDTLLANYTFMSEGVESVREVIFLKTGQNFTEGYGPVKDENGKMVFEDHSKIDFSKSTPLLKVECNKGNL